MANDIDPITGLPPLTYERPQTKRIEEDLEKRMSQGAEGLYQKAIREDSRKAELERDINWLRRRISGFSTENKEGTGPSASLEAELRGHKQALARAESEYAGLGAPISREQAKEQFLSSGEGKLLVGAQKSLGREQELLGDISGVRLSAEQEMARELQRRMEGIQAEEAEVRGVVGESGAKRGLLRSTFTQSGIEQSALREQERIGTERIGVQSQIMNLRNAETQLVKEIENQREKMLLIRDVNELAEIESKRNMLIESKIRTDFMTAMANAQIKAQKKAAMMGTLTSLASTAVMAYAVSGGGAAACWVARAIFGIDNIKWVFARTYVVQDSPRWFFNLYVKYGEEFAKKVEKSKVLKLILKPIFNYFAFRGRKKWHL